MKKLSQAGVLAVASLFTSLVSAMPYTFSESDLTGFYELWDAPAGSAQLWAPGILPSGEFGVFISDPSVMSNFGLGTESTNDLSLFDGLEMNLHNSSFGDFQAALFVATVENDVVSYWFGDAVALAQDTGAVLGLDFTNVSGTGGTGVDVSQFAGNFAAYGFAITTEGNYFIHAQVPAPATLFLLGAGLIGLARVARKRQ